LNYQPVSEFQHLSLSEIEAGNSVSAMLFVTNFYISLREICGLSQSAQHPYYYHLYSRETLR